MQYKICRRFRNRLSKILHPSDSFYGLILRLITRSKKLLDYKIYKLLLGHSCLFQIVSRMSLLLTRLLLKTLSL